jgi:hypothetical protein
LPVQSEELFGYRWEVFRVAAILYYGGKD